MQLEMIIRRRNLQHRSFIWCRVGCSHQQPWIPRAIPLERQEINTLQRETYSTIGGTPHLDGNYTVFGELLKGLEVVDAIAGVKTDERDRPMTDERFSMHLLTRVEARDFERELQGLKPKKGIFTKLFDSMKSRTYKLP